MSSPAAAACDLCNGTGWIPVDGSFDARPCVCQADTRRRHRMQAAAIPKRYHHCRIEEFHDSGNPTLRNAKRRVMEFVDCWTGGAEQGLLLMGGCGVGKTHLAVAALQEIIRSGKPGKLLFSNFQDLIQAIQASFNSDQSPSKSEIMNPLLEADLLVLDELGSQKPTPFVHDVLYYVINTRYNDEKTTVFTTNYVDEPRDPKEETLAGRIGDRLRSRLYDMADRVIIESDDYRKRPKSQLI